VTQLHKRPKFKLQPLSRAKHGRALTISAVLASAGLFAFSFAVLLQARRPPVSLPEQMSDGGPQGLASADIDTGVGVPWATDGGPGLETATMPAVPERAATPHAGPGIVALLQSDETFPVPASEPTSPIEMASGQSLEVGSIATSQAAPARRDKTAGPPRAAAVAATRARADMRNASTRPEINKRREQTRRREPAPVQTAEARRSDDNPLPSVLRLAD
jgi:hypothetical protein